MVGYFERAFAGITCGLMSGGLQYREGEQVGDTQSSTSVAPRVTAVYPNITGVVVIPGVLHCERRATGLFAVQRNEKGEIETGWQTFISPHYQCVVLMGQAAMQRGNIWDDEVWLCQNILERLETWDLSRTITIAYGGGVTTGKELEQAARSGRRVAVVAGAGGMCDKMLRDDEFRKLPNVHPVKLTNPSALRELLGGVWN
jgi:hypothetical protein